MLKSLLEGPTALAFVRGDAAAAAKAISDYGRRTDLLPFKGGLMNGEGLDPDQIRAIARLPSREVLYAQLVGVVAHPISGLARTLNALISGLAIALGQIQEKGLIGQGAPAAAAPAAAPLVTLDAVQRDHIRRVLAHTGGRVYGKGGAAQILGLKPSTLQSRMKKLGVLRADS